jgi:hypothetical protein
MSGIYISHTGADAEIATALAAELEGRGYSARILDFHPEHGTPKGRDWEWEVMHQLRDCQAVLAVSTPTSLRSRWCFAELTHARALGKPVFPLVVQECEPDPLLSDRPVVDFLEDTEDFEAGYTRLAWALGAAGILPEERVNWDPRRPPYPGLVAFPESYAPVLFSRQGEAQMILDDLNRRRRFGGAPLTIVTGAPGVGKSSLLRAGVMPLLRKDEDHWLVVGPIIPRGRPAAHLAAAIADLSGQARDQAAWRTLYEHVEVQSDGEHGLPDRDGLSKALRDITHARGTPAARPLILVDQVEETFTAADPRELSHFLKAIAWLCGEDAGVWKVVICLRSDFVNSLQAAIELAGMRLVTHTVTRLKREELAEVIGGPARLAGCKLEDGLLEALLDDATAVDALPHLAFCLRELWELGAERRVMTLSDYRELLGSVSDGMARAAETCVGHLDKVPERRDQLRRAFLCMASMDEEGRLTRRRARAEELPGEILLELKSLAEARLLLSSGKAGSSFFEAPHVALFHGWRRLERWLDEEQSLLGWLKRLGHSLDEWLRAGKSRTALLRPGALGEALDWRRRHESVLSGDEKAFIQASEQAQGRERVVSRSIVALVLTVLLALTGWALLSRSEMADTHRNMERSFKEATRRRDLALAATTRARAETRQFRDHAIFTAALSTDSPVDIALLLAEHERAQATTSADAADADTTTPPEIRGALRGAIRRLPPLARTIDGGLLAPKPSSDGDRSAGFFFAAGSGHLLLSDGAEAMVVPMTGPTRRVALGPRVIDVRLTPDGEALHRLLDDKRTIETIKVADGEVVKRLLLTPAEGTKLPPEAAPSSARLAADGQRVLLIWPGADKAPARMEVRDLAAGQILSSASVSSSLKVRGLLGQIAALEDGAALWLGRPDGQDLRSVGAADGVLSPDGERIARSQQHDRTASVQVLGWRAARTLYARSSRGVDHAAAASLGGRSRLLTDLSPGVLEVRDLARGREVAWIEVEPGAALLRLSPDGRFAARLTLRARPRLDVWDLDKALGLAAATPDPASGPEAVDWLTPTGADALLARPVSLTAPCPAEGASGGLLRMGAFDAPDDMQHADALLSADGRWIMARRGCADAAFKRVDRTTGESLDVGLAPVGRVEARFLLPGGERALVSIAKADDDGAPTAAGSAAASHLRLYDLKSGKERCVLDGASASMSRMGPEGRWLMTLRAAPSESANGAARWTLTYWDLESCTPSTPALLGDGALELLAQEKRPVFFTLEGGIWIAASTDGRLLKASPPLAGEGLAPRGAGRRLATPEVESFARPALAGAVAAALASDRSRLAVATTGNVVTLLDPKTLTVLDRIDVEIGARPTRLSFTPDGQRLVVWVARQVGEALEETERLSYRIGWRDLLGAVCSRTPRNLSVPLHERLFEHDDASGPRTPACPLTPRDHAWRAPLAPEGGPQN